MEFLIADEFPTYQIVLEEKPYKTRWLKREKSVWLWYVYNIWPTGKPTFAWEGRAYSRSEAIDASVRRMRQFQEYKDSTVNRDERIREAALAQEREEAQ